MLSTARHSVLPLTALLAALLVGCAGLPPDRVTGSGDPATEDRSVGAFTELSAGMAIAVTVTVGAPVSVRVTADDNLLAKVTTTVTGNRLDIAISGSTHIRTPVAVAVSVPSLTLIGAHTAANVTATGIDTESLTIDADTAGVIQATGRANSLHLTAASGATVDLNAVPVGAVHATVTLGGITTVNASGAVTGTASTGGILRIGGSPTSVDVATELGGQVVRV